MMGASQQQTPPADDHAATRHAASASGITGAIGIPNRPVILAGIRTGLDSIYPACTLCRGAARFNRGCSGYCAPGKTAPGAPGALGGAHRAEWRGGGRAGRSGAVPGPYEQDTGAGYRGTQPKLRGGGNHRQCAGRSPGRGPNLPGGLCLQRFQPDRWQHRHQCRRHPGHPLRHDPQLGHRFEGGHGYR